MDKRKPDVVITVRTVYPRWVTIITMMALAAAVGLVAAEVWFTR